MNSVSLWAEERGLVGDLQPLRGKAGVLPRPLWPGAGVSYLGLGSLGQGPVLLETRAQGGGRSHLTSGRGQQSSGRVAFELKPKEARRSPVLSCYPARHPPVPPHSRLGAFALASGTFLSLPGWLHSRSTQPPSPGIQGLYRHHLRG